MKSHSHAVYLFHLIFPAGELGFRGGGGGGGAEKKERGGAITRLRKGGGRRGGSFFVHPSSVT